MIPAEFGATPWGRAWLRTIEPTAVSAPNPLLPKARTLARNDAVRLATDGRGLAAEVSVSGAVHKVRVDVPHWPAPTEAVARRLIATALADNRGLAAGDLPDTLATNFRHHDIGVAVELGGDAAVCDCRTRKRPCVHILASIYTLTQLIDERPALAIELRSPHVATPAAVDAGWIALADLDASAFYG